MADDVAVPGGKSPIARAKGLHKTFGKGDTRVTALDGVDVAFGRGELTAIMGPSGSGKSTLMHCMAGLDAVDSGAVFIEDSEITALSQSELTKLRRTRLGFIFQSFNLVPTLSAEENIVLPLTLARQSVDRDWFSLIIEVVGLGDRLRHRPDQLSGGQQQRVACARALITRPAVIFADEPTGNLDSTSAGEVMRFLRRSVDEFGQSVIIVTHDPGTAVYADRVLFLADGRLVADLDGKPSEDRIIDELRIHTARRQAPATSPIDVLAGDQDIESSLEQPAGTED